MAGTVMIGMVTLLAISTNLVSVRTYGDGSDTNVSDETLQHSHELIVLVHGFGRTSRDMRFLRDYFTSRGYSVYAPTLPTFFQSVEDCAEILEKKLAQKDSVRAFDHIHFVGHSMGGLIVRKYLANNYIKNLGRCVLIGSPNGGTPLGAMIKKYAPPLTWISPAYRSFQPGGIPIPPPQNNPPPDLGAIAGNGDGLWGGCFIKVPNDGRVPVDSVPFDGMTAFIVLPYHHEHIHHQYHTAELIKHFVATGQFAP